MNSIIPRTAGKYIENMKSKVEEYWLTESLIEISVSGNIKEKFRKKITNIDKESKGLMVHAEKKFRKIKSRCIPFSPESSLWIRRKQVYSSLLRYHARKISNNSNLKRSSQ